jgi:Alpha/beta hydrolase family
LSKSLNTLMDIIAIHGAWSSSISFNHLRTQIKGSWHAVDYDHATDTMWDIIGKTNEIIKKPSVIIGHSLGGIAAMHVHDNPLVRGIITLASPLAGLELNLLQIYLSRSKLIAQIASDTHLIRDMKKRQYDKPVLHLVANRGFNPFIYEDSDGVLPRKVQTGWGCGDFQEITANHYEILQSPESIVSITGFIAKIS